MPQQNHNVTAILGPTNTGKTHLAIERMLAHESGIIGLPLRLLAREVYTRMVAKAGPEAIALITGEEKIVPARARYYVCTVEAMPQSLDVAFVAVDEVQLAADLDRGHVFTQRLLHLRGSAETLLLGAHTVRPVIETLLPGTSILTRPRFSDLRYSGSKKLTRLPARTAIVAFSAQDVYEIAELIRRQRGGAAVVLGSLSPRTRNAQVALYQAGDVDYLVATDAIGMGLNLDVNHVALAGCRKFDGHQYRALTPAEMAQIAGRAGRFRRDGTFGVTGRLEPFDARLVEAIESHEFATVNIVQWRNDILDFSSLKALRASLDVLPDRQGLTRTPPGADVLAVDYALKHDRIAPMATTTAAIERLWQVCQLPDYRKIAPASHFELIASLYTRLMQHGALPDDWLAQQLAFSDNTDGDIDTIANRIAHIRTWTFAANRPDWLEDAKHWQERTRAIEDKLSDALHARLMQRFVDKRTSVLMKHLRENETLSADVNDAGDIWVEGHGVGRMNGFCFSPRKTAPGLDAKLVRAAAQRIVAREIQIRAEKLSRAGDGAFALEPSCRIIWDGAHVAQLQKGAEPLSPQIAIVADEHLSGHPRQIVQDRLARWINDHLRHILFPLFALGEADDLEASVRGLAFRLVEAYGVIERRPVAAQVRAINQSQRALLRKKGVRFGAYHIYIPQLLRPQPRALLMQLYLLSNPQTDGETARVLLKLVSSGRTSLPIEAIVSPELYGLAGFRVCGKLAVRVDILERLADLIRPAIAWRGAADTMQTQQPAPVDSPPEAPAAAKTEMPPGAAAGNGFVVSPEMISLLGCSREEMASVLGVLGYCVQCVPATAGEEGLFPGADGDETQLQSVEIWRRRSDARKKHNRERTSATPPGPSRKAKPKHGHAQRTAALKQGAPPRARRVRRGAKVPDPDSPFAALAVLKKGAGKNKAPKTNT